jgi:hypothetical protein
MTTRETFLCERPPGDADGEPVRVNIDAFRKCSCSRQNIPRFFFPHDYIVTCMIDSRRGFGLEVGLIGHFSTQVVVTLNYSAIADFHTLQVFFSPQYLH